MHRDHDVAREEDRDLDVAHDVRLGLFQGVGDDEVVVFVFVDLRPLVPVHGVLDRQRMQLELLGDELDVAFLRVADVQPCAAVAQLREVLDGALLHAAVGLANEQAGWHAPRLRL